MDIKEVKKIIFSRDGNKCYKCNSPERLVLDHVNPKYLFHYHGIDNILTLCWDCNGKKYKSILPQNEIDEIKKYLNEVNKNFTIEEANEMARIIEEHFNNQKKRPHKKEIKFQGDWRELCVPDKNGKINKWSMYRMRD
jgi:hypothetical protein